MQLAALLDLSLLHDGEKEVMYYLVFESTVVADNLTNVVESVCIIDISSGTGGTGQPVCFTEYQGSVNKRVISTGLLYR